MREKKNRCIARSIKPQKYEVEMFKVETLQIDPFWNDLLEYKKWKKRVRT